MQNRQLKTADAGIFPKIPHLGGLPVAETRFRAYTSYGMLVLTRFNFFQSTRGILMKTILKSLLLLSATLFFSSQAAAEDSYLKGVGIKLGHGAMNAVSGIAEVPRNMLYESNDKGIGYGLTTGLFKGIGYGVGRTGAGFLDLATFFIPSKPIIAPGYVWENFTTEPTHFRPWR